MTCMYVKITLGSYERVKRTVNYSFFYARKHTNSGVENDQSR